MAESALGPDLVIAGAARSGTSSLAARLGEHPAIDPGSVKESNYFSRGLHRGRDWYDGLYAERRNGLLRMDASTSYTSPSHPDALAELAAVAPGATVVYAVRQPTERALSHYLFRRHHFGHDDRQDFGSALHASTWYEETSDYSHWLPALQQWFPAQHVLVVPFEVITTQPTQATDAICNVLGLAPVPPADETARRHRNQVVTYRSGAARWAARVLRRSVAYPKLRTLIGPDLTRSVRDLFTTPAPLPTNEEAMTSCGAEQLDRLRRLDERAGAAVRQWLLAQDQRLGLDWLTSSFANTAASPGRTDTSVDVRAHDGSSSGPLSGRPDMPGGADSEVVDETARGRSGR